MEILRRNYSDLPSQSAPPIQSVRVGNFLSLSGATARDTAAEYCDMAAQTDVILKGIQHILESEGGWRTWSR